MTQTRYKTNEAANIAIIDRFHAMQTLRPVPGHPEAVREIRTGFIWRIVHHSRGGFIIRPVRSTRAPNIGCR